MANLTYKIVNKRKLENDELGLDYYDVEWTSALGLPADTERHPVTHPPNIEYEDREVSQREVIKDQISVPHGTVESIVLQKLEEKRPRLAEALGVAP